MDGDPWDWSVQQVAAFFDNHAHTFVKHLPNSRFPESAPFAQHLIDNKVAGWMLLTVVDTEFFLRDVCQIASFDVRCTVMYCVGKLRAESRRYACECKAPDLLRRGMLGLGGVSEQPRSSISEEGPAVKLTDVQPHTLSKTTDNKDQVQSIQNVDTMTAHARLVSSGSELLVEEKLGIRNLGGCSLLPTYSGQPAPNEQSTVLSAREGEYLVDGERGRKRRKLNISQIVTADSIGDRHTSEAILSADQVFFGDTAMGQEIADFQLDNQQNADGDSEDNFQFHSFDKDPHQRQYVWGYLKHFLGNGTVQELERHGRLAMAVLPYTMRHVAEDKPRSAIVFQVRRDNGTIKAVRENAALIQGNYDYQEVNAVPMSTRWDYLVEKYKESDVLPAYGASDHDAMPTSSQETDRDDDLDVSNGLTERSKSDIVGNAIDNFVREWRDKLPQMESRRAWLTWRKASNSKIKRDSLVVAAKAEVKGFEQLLAKFKTELLAMEWRSERSLLRTCDALKVTVENREEAAWKVDVFQRQEEPSHTAQPGHRNGTTAKAAHRPSSPDSFIQSDDLDVLSGNDDGNPMDLDEPGPENSRASETLLHIATTVSLGAATDPVDLTYSSRESSPPSIKPNNKPTQLELSDSSDPFEATVSLVESWNFDKQNRNKDHARMLIKLLCIAGPEFRENLYQCSQRLRRSRFVEVLKQTVRILSNGDNAPTELEPMYRETMRKCAWIAVAWYFYDLDIVLTEKLVPDVQWERMIPNCDQQLETFFVDYLLKALRKRNTRLFVVPQKLTTNAVVVSSDDDDYTILSDDTPRKKRRKPVKVNEASKQTRDQAFERQQKFDSVIASQSSSTQLATLPSETSVIDSQISINPAKGNDEKYLYIPSNIARLIRSHQISGIRFMWREITNDGSDEAQGCILAHTMGLGKTMQTVTFLAVLNKAAHSQDLSVNKQLPSRLRLGHKSDQRQLRMLILAPPALLLNWNKEIDQWAPGALGRVSIVDADMKGYDARVRELQLWHRNGGVLLIGYHLFRELIQNLKGEKMGQHADDIARFLLHDPDIVVADEAHELKNEASKIAESVCQVQTHSRVGLTGTPMSNDVKEIYSLVSFVAPDYLGSLAEFRDQFERPIVEGNASTSTEGQCRKGIKKLAILHNEINPKIHRADITVLKGLLKPKVEFIITLPLTEIQQSIFDALVEMAQQPGQKSTLGPMNVISWLGTFIVLVNHPFVLRKKLEELRSKQQQQASQLPQNIVTHEDASSCLIEAEDAVENAEGNTSRAGKKAIGAEPLGLSKATLKSLICMIPDDDNPNNSSKTIVLLDIVKRSRECGDKILVFSNSIPTLDYLEELLPKEGHECMRIDGKVSTGKRSSIVAEFKDNPEVCVMLISTKAGGTGLNIESANRVVIFDFGFNPAHDKQAIGRAYRLGQQKPVYVYRFVTGGTFEEKMYGRQMFKNSLTLRVVDKKNPQRVASSLVQQYLHKVVPIKRTALDLSLGKDPRVLDQIATDESLIYALNTMETLQEDAGDEKLSAQELLEVEQEIEANKSKRSKGGKGLPYLQVYQPRSAGPSRVGPPQSALSSLMNSEGNVLPGSHSVQQQQWPGHGNRGNSLGDLPTRWE